MQIYFISYKKPPTSQPGFATKKKGGGDSYLNVLDSQQSLISVRLPA